MDYRAYQLSMRDIPTEIQQALNQYIQRYGQPPQILLESSLEQVPLPEGMNIVTQAVHLPKNIILIGSIE